MPGRKGSQAARVDGPVRAGVAEPEGGSDGSGLVRGKRAL